MHDDDPDPWYAEADAIEVEERDFDVASCAELPIEIAHHAVAAELDPGFDDDCQEWLEKLGEDNVPMLALEQSCSLGILLPWDMRGARLLTAPMYAIDLLHLFWNSSHRHLSAHLSHYVFWLVRSERARRRGTPEWSRGRPCLPPKSSMLFSGRAASLFVAGAVDRLCDGPSNTSRARRERSKGRQRLPPCH